jgi:hypothetical protein
MHTIQLRLSGSRALLGVVLLLVAICVAGITGREAAFAQQPSPLTVDVTLDRSHATVGDPIGLIIVLRYDNGVQVNTDGIEDQFGPFEALSGEPPADRRNANGSGEIKLQYKVAAYRTGPTELPALTIAYGAGGQSASVSTAPITFTVDSVIPPGDKATEIRPLKPQIEIPLPSSAALRRSLGAAAGVLLVAVLALILWRRLRYKPVMLAPVEPLEPTLEAEARAELDRIVAEQYLAQGDYRTHYALVAACIRRYLTERYGFQASALTTAQLPERMVLRGVGRWRARLVAGLLAECDAVHYAHYLPAAARAEADLQMAYEVVDLALSQETRSEDGLMEAGG